VTTTGQWFRVGHVPRSLHIYQKENLNSSIHSIQLVTKYIRMKDFYRKMLQ